MIRLFGAVAISGTLLLAGCFLRKDEPDTEVTYSDPLDDSWYKEPTEESATVAETAQARPLTSRDATTATAQQGNSLGSPPVQQPDWGSPVSAPPGELGSSFTASDPPTGGNPGAIVGAPVGGEVISETGPKSTGGSLIASNTGIGTDAGDSYPGAGASGDLPASGLHLDSTPPPSLTGAGTGAQSAVGRTSSSPLGSSAINGLNLSNRPPDWNSSIDGSAATPPRNPDSTLTENLPPSKSNATSPPVDPTFDDPQRVGLPSGFGASATSTNPPPPDPMKVTVPSQRDAPSAQSPSTAASNIEPTPNAEALKDEAVNQYKTGNFSEATRLFRQFQSAYPDQSTDWVQWHLSQSLLEQGLWGEAGEEFRKLVGSRNRELRAEALLKLGIIDAKRGNFEIAKNRWDRILAEYPDTKAAKRATQELSQNRP